MLERYQDPTRQIAEREITQDPLDQNEYEAFKACLPTWRDVLIAKTLRSTGFRVSAAVHDYSFSWSWQAPELRLPPVVSDEEVAWACAQETVKYFGDGWDLGGEKPNRITKSTTWLRVSEDDEGELGPCEYCDDYHRTEYVGCAGQVEKDFPGIVGAWDDGLAFYPPGGAPCLCWGALLQKYFLFQKSIGCSKSGFAPK